MIIGVAVCTWACVCVRVIERKRESVCLCLPNQMRVAGFYIPNVIDQVYAISAQHRRVMIFLRHTLTPCSLSRVKGAPTTQLLLHVKCKSLGQQLALSPAFPLSSSGGIQSTSHMTLQSNQDVLGLVLFPWKLSKVETMEQTILE